MATDEVMSSKALGEKLLASVRQMNNGLGKVVHFPVLAARQAAGSAVDANAICGAVGGSGTNPVRMGTRTATTFACGANIGQCGHLSPPNELC